MGKNQFKSLYKSPREVDIGEIIQMTAYFSKFVNDEHNRVLYEEVAVEELKEVLHSFEKGKILGPNEWPIEFYIGFYETLGNDLLQVIKESR
jgi:hypothetical protein